jgi:hypothetical protein
VLAFLILLLAGHHAVTRPTLQTVPTKPGAWPVRRHPRLLHLDPYLRGDSLAAVRLAGWLRRHGRVWGIDQNGNRTADRTVWILHWARYRMQYPWIWTGERGIGGREIRRRVPPSWPVKFYDLHDHQAAMLRSARIGGRRPHRARRHMAEAAKAGVPWCLEGKNKMHAADWDRLTRDAAETGVVCVFMVLSSWPDWQADIRVAAEHGWAVAVLPRTHRPAGWAAFQAETGCQVWGHWR